MSDKPILTLPEGITHEDYFHLLTHYYDELKHRDNLFWKQTFTYFYATLIFSILPIVEPFGLHIPDEIPRILFPIMGIIMSLCFLFVSLNYAVRLKCIGNTHVKLLGMLPKDLQRVSVKEISTFKPYKWQMAKAISWIMFALLLILNVLIIAFTI